MHGYWCLRMPLIAKQCCRQHDHGLFLSCVISLLRLHCVTLRLRPSPSTLDLSWVFRHVHMLRGTCRAEAQGKPGLSCLLQTLSVYHYQYVCMFRQLGVQKLSGSGSCGSQENGGGRSLFNAPKALVGCDRVNVMVSHLQV